VLDRNAMKWHPLGPDERLPKQYTVRRWSEEHAGRGEDNPIEDVRMMRDGWTCLDGGDPGPHSGGAIAWDFRSPEIYARASPDKALQLRRYLRAIYKKGGAWYNEDFEILDRDDRVLRTIADGSWADWDPSGNLLFAREGCLYRVPRRDVPKPADDALTDAHKIADLRPMTFEQAIAPEWALKWP
jgi:hypothetical protein